MSDETLDEMEQNARNCLAIFGDAPEPMASYCEGLRRFLALVERCRVAETERDKLAAFKKWVHDYLDAHEVPHHPPGTHGAEGCRIGDRMDWLMDQLKKAEERAEKAEIAGMEVGLEKMGLMPDQVRARRTGP